MTLQHDNARMVETIALLNGLGEIVSARRGDEAMKYTYISLDAVQAIYELDDADRSAVRRLVERYEELYDSYLTARQVAERLKTRPRVIKWLARKDYLHGTKRGGKWVFRPKTVEKFIEEHTCLGGVRLAELERELAENPA